MFATEDIHPLGTPNRLSKKGGPGEGRERGGERKELLLEMNLSLAVLMV